MEAGSRILSKLGSRLLSKLAKALQLELRLISKLPKALQMELTFSNWRCFYFSKRTKEKPKQVVSLS
jgi:hypothetical protein